MADNLNEQIKRLKIFNETVDILRTYEFSKLKKVGISMTSKKNEDAKIETKSVSEEYTAAFISKFRRFIMDKDKISFNQLKNIYEELPISEQFKENYTKLHGNINAYLNSKTGIDRRLTQPEPENVVRDYISEQQLKQIAIDASTKDDGQSNIDELTRREIFDNIIWGHYSHTELESKNQKAGIGEILEDWYSSFVWNFIEVEFICIVMQVTDFAIAINDLNEIVIEEIEKDA